jgi:hypothetical protein
MNTAQIVATLKDERDRIDYVIEILGNGSKPRRGRPPGRPPLALTGDNGGARRRLSSAARKRIAAGMKKSWAARKKAKA